MNPDFYQYTILNINPDDDLYGDEFHIKQRLGIGVTSIAYLLVNQDDDQPAATRISRVMKISKAASYERIFMNEIKILQQLKELTNSNNFNLFFSNIIKSSPEGKFILVENQLISLTSINLHQAEQLISIIEHLYKCGIIHRDIQPQNLMFDETGKHLKLIDFGFATTLENNENTKELGIEDVVLYAGLKFLELYLQAIHNAAIIRTYKYERTFDLTCALNVIMYMKDEKIANNFKLLKNLSLVVRAAASYEFWFVVKEKNKNYNGLLNLIDNLSDFETIKNRIKVLF
ncbi:unnamed protein product [Rotaria sp. Silwood1]|nr:unnamed protein product [Rotaria sp. Silwood1]CAF1614674.1 unnamed protein product [Rotaria sp. Silwood1]